MNRPVYSVVIPFYNEGENLSELIVEIDAMLGRLGEAAEIVLVDDGSTDRFERPAASPWFPISWLRLDRNSGQSAALYFGMQRACGAYVILMDADLQNDPADAPKLLAKLREEKLDLVTGVRTDRHDSWFRRLSGKVANGVRAVLLQDRTTDTGCTLKVMPLEVARRLPCWKGMHRFIPALVLACGYRIGELPVNHRARKAGVSKVSGGKRAWEATCDLFGMLWLSRRQVKGRLVSDDN